MYIAKQEKKVIFLLSQLIGYKAVNIKDLNSNIPNMDIIFNTIPTLILDSKKLKLVKKESLIVDLASSPGGVDLEFAKKQNIHVEWALALPAKVAPMTAAKYIKEEIDNIII